ncbi:MAG: hypothetical protein QOJ82_3472 [Solirubrobacteraceae bacterium]|jgi:hypothetical protein|nr:hypothetical protein [Solirubrobacteraceae bacterium]
MRTRTRALLAAIAVAVLGALVLAKLGLETMAFTDYENESEPSFLALRHGHLAGFLDHLPAYGGSLILRSPFALLPGLWHGGDLAVFRSVAAPCLLAAAALAVVLWRRARSLGLGAGAAWLALILVSAHPLALRALEIGHPEELLGGVLCVAAGLAAANRRPLLAGALLGMAMANKPWAVLAVLPVVLMLPAARARAIALAGAVAGAVMAPMLLLGSAGLAGTVAVAHGSGAIFQPRQLWWFLGHHAPGPVDPHVLHAGYRIAPDWVAHVSHPAALLAGLLLAVVAGWRRRLLTPAEGFGLLALVLLARCLLDTWNTDYYLLPVCLALVAWEVHARRAPVVTLAVTVVAWTAFEFGPGRLSPDLQAAIFLAWSVPLAIALGLGVLHPEGARRLAARAAAAAERWVPTLAAAARPTA